MYREALKKNKGTKWAKPYLGRSFQYEYSAGKIQGELFMDTLSFQDKAIFAKNQVFGIVDEVKSPDAKRWRENENTDVKGIFGIGPRALNRNIILGPDGKVIPGKDVPTVLDTMKRQGKISAKIIGINFRLPNEESRGTSNSSQASSSSDTGTVDGILHFGGVKEGAFNTATMKIIPATQRGESQHFYGIDLTLKHGETVLMDNKPGIIDTGSSFISLPEEVLAAYVKAIGNHRDGTPIMTYDKTHGLYRIAKKDFGRLKDLKFNFVRGENAKFRFSPFAQVFPPALTEDWSTDSKDVLFMSFRRLKHAHEGRQFILGIAWSKSILSYILEN